MAIFLGPTVLVIPSDIPSHIAQIMPDATVDTSIHPCGTILSTALAAHAEDLSLFKALESTQNSSAVVSSPGADDLQTVYASLDMCMFFWTRGGNLRRVQG
jgi:hypothetical protein